MRTVLTSFFMGIALLAAEMAMAGETGMTVERALATMAGEAGLHQLQRAALERADADIAGSRHWMSATRWSAVLPVLKVTVEQDMERDESLDRYQDEPDRWGADTDRDLGFQVSAQWNLPELIFNPDEMRVYSSLANRAARREALLTVLVGYYFERRKLIVTRLVSPPADPTAALEQDMRIAELTALIDALTGGRLSSTLKK